MSGPAPAARIMQLRPSTDAQAGVQQRAIHARFAASICDACDNECARSRHLRLSPDLTIYWETL